MIYNNDNNNNKNIKMYVNSLKTFGTVWWT